MEISTKVTSRKAMAADTEIATMLSFSAVYFKHVIDFTKYGFVWGVFAHTKSWFFVGISVKPENTVIWANH